MTNGSVQKMRPTGSRQERTSAELRARLRDGAARARRAVDRSREFLKKNSVRDEASAVGHGNNWG